MRAFLFVLSLLIIVSCNNDGQHKTAPATDSYPEAYKSAVEMLASQPNQKSARVYTAELRKLIVNVEDKSEKLTLLKKGLETAEKYKLGPTAIGFLIPLVKDYRDDANKEEYLAKLASVLQDVGKSIPGDIIAKAYAEKYPNGQYNDVLNAKKKEKIDDLDAYLKGLAENIFVDPDKFGINRISAQKYVDACEAFAFGYPENAEAPKYLYKAAEMAKTLRTFPKALGLYDWIIDHYPNYEKMATVLFLKGFMLDDVLNDKENAKVVYQSFLQKFPNHALKDDVSFLLNNIDKTEEEIMQLLEENKKAGK